MFYPDHHRYVILLLFCYQFLVLKKRCYFIISKNQISVSHFPTGVFVLTSLKTRAKEINRDFISYHTKNEHDLMRTGSVFRKF